MTHNRLTQPSLTSPLPTDLSSTCDWYEGCWLAAATALFISIIYLFWLIQLPHCFDRSILHPMIFSVPLSPPRSCSVCISQCHSISVQWRLNLIPNPQEVQTSQDLSLANIIPAKPTITQWMMHSGRRAVRECLSVCHCLSHTTACWWYSCWLMIQ